MAKTETTSQQGSHERSHPEEDEGNCVVNNGFTYCK